MASYYDLHTFEFGSFSLISKIACGSALIDAMLTLY